MFITTQIRYLQKMQPSYDIRDRAKCFIYIIMNYIILKI